jgi:hypothetical protein
MDTAQVLDHRPPIFAVKGRGMKKNNGRTRSGFPECKARAVRLKPPVHTLGGYASGITIGSSGMPIQQARYAIATRPPEKQKVTTVKMRTRATSHPYA